MAVTRFREAAPILPEMAKSLPFVQLQIETIHTPADYSERSGGLDIHGGDVIGLCVDSQCTFKQALEFPGVVDAGLRAAQLGNSSVRYEIGLFREDSDLPAATGRFVHVFVAREDRRPVPVPDRIRAALEGITG